MQMFGNLSTEGLEEAGDRIGGSLFESDYYVGTVKLVYAGKSQSSNAQSVTAVIDINGREFKETFWVTNKDGQNFYVDKNDANKKHPLPGFTMADDLAQLTTGYPLAAQEAEEKVISIYNFEQKKEIPTPAMVFTGMLGKQVGVAVLQQTVDKQQKVGNEYVNTGQTRNENVADKFFHAETHRTVTEVKNGVTDSVFRDKWIERNAGKTRDRTDKKSNVQSGRPAAAGGAAAGGNKPASLFG